METISFAALDPAVAAALPREDTDFTEVHLLSDIDVIRKDLTLGAQIGRPSGLMVNLAYSLVDYEDKAPLLVDESGEYQVIFGSIGWRF